jgi:hypothetical protein
MTESLAENPGLTEPLSATQASNTTDPKRLNAIHSSPADNPAQFLELNHPPTPALHRAPIAPRL